MMHDVKKQETFCRVFEIAAHCHAGNEIVLAFYTQTTIHNIGSAQC